MADLAQQAAIGDDTTFRLRVRQAAIKRALVERAKPAEQTTTPAQKTALQVLEQSDSWSVQIARSLATHTAGTAITTAAQITDEQITLFLDQVFAAYLEVS